MGCFVTYHSKPGALSWLFILHNYMDLTPIPTGLLHRLARVNKTQEVVLWKNTYATIVNIFIMLKEKTNALPVVLLWSTISTSMLNGSPRIAYWGNRLLHSLQRKRKILFVLHLNCSILLGKKSTSDSHPNTGSTQIQGQKMDLSQPEHKDGNATVASFIPTYALFPPG